ncbi:hypothetical protein [Sphingomonas sp. MA1305]|uniref:hypothetical protein n=1 Tax=Sphingomonas sp. MA1305 TaxID=2479204 RepID=UPI0018E056E1|nr:hypothetical protein [Sphingomonas sp. MA1305]
MTAEQFAYWMQGFAELTGDEVPTAGQWRSIREHLQTVFVKVTPPLQDWRPDVNDTRKVPKVYPGTSPAVPYDWHQRPTTGTPPNPLIATCIAVQGEHARTIC